MVMDMVGRAARRRETALADLDETERAARGQFFTPTAVAKIMARLLKVPDHGVVRVLDPGAGSGMLTATLVSHLATVTPSLRVHVTAVEDDTSLLPALRETLDDCSVLGAETRLIAEDYVSWAVTSDERFDLVIQNPPYHKLRVDSTADVLLRNAGIVVPNIYAGFMALAARQLTPGGQMVAITPRSWMNGTYYESFRRGLLDRAAIDAIHTFASRSSVFGDMGVLQESIIVSVTSNAIQGPVRLYSSVDQASETAERIVPGNQVVTPDFVFVPASRSDADAVSWMASATRTLADLGLTVSTGRVVDFRSRDLLRHSPDQPCSPMIYPANIVERTVQHPRTRLRKPQWFAIDSTTASKLLVPAGVYVLVKRFSSKEEKRRIVAAVWDDDRAPAFDNKLNYIHRAGHGLDPGLARGLAIWLNSTRVDDYFRVFSGHTQVNATDLRHMRFPSHTELLELARTNSDIDIAVEQLFAARRKAA